MEEQKQIISESLKEHSQSQSFLKDEISGLIEGIKKESKSRYAYWAEVMGEKIAKVAVPVKNKKGILFVKVPDATWRFELTRRKPEILKLLNEHLKKNLILDIVFI